MEDIQFKFYKVGGFVRDQLLNVPSKDIDYAVIALCSNDVEIDTIFHMLCKYLENKGYTIYLKTLSCYTIRAKDSKHETADFVLARKDGDYNNDSRKPKVMLGTLEDDLLRRDFTINALALDENNNIVDICNGLEDLKNKILRTPLNANISLMNDPLRIIRGLRFCITKGFTLDDDFWKCLSNDDIWIKFEKVISVDRVREELDKMFKFDTIKTLNILDKLNKINQNSYRIILKNISLVPKTINL